MARSLSAKKRTQRPLATLPETVVTARAMALGLPRFAVRLIGVERLKLTSSSWIRRPC